jgi:hypothetical protein
MLTDSTYFLDKNGDFGRHTQNLGRSLDKLGSMFLSRVSGSQLSLNHHTALCRIALMRSAGVGWE